ncbi:MAG: peptide-methionine (S)-S-oxide reductase [Terriglobales bacterium]
MLQRTLAFIGGTSAIIYSHDAELNVGDFECTLGVDPHFCSLYLARYMRLNPMIPYEDSLPAGAAFSASDALPYKQLRSSTFFKEWAKPQGYVDFIGTVLEKANGRMVKLLINRHERHGLVDERARRAMELLAPHFRRALHIGKLPECRGSEAAGLTEILDRISIAVIFVDAAGRLVHANRAGLQRLAEGDVLGWRDGQPRLRDPEAATQLQALLLESARLQGADVAVSATHAMTAGSGERLTLDILPLPAVMMRNASGAAAAIVLRTEVAPDFAERLAGYGAITTQILPAPPFYYAEDYHQQYLAKNPDGYCPDHSCGVPFKSAQLQVGENA